MAGRCSHLMHSFNSSGMQAAVALDSRPSSMAPDATTAACTVHDEQDAVRQGTTRCSSELHHTQLHALLKISSIMT
jgi:hypothetical protein